MANGWLIVYTLSKDAELANRGEAAHANLTELEFPVS